MRNLIVSSLVSLDGIYGDPQSWAWEYFDQQAAEESPAVLNDSDAMLMGRNAYHYFAPFWSSLPGPYPERINQIRKYIFSSTLTAADWNNTTIIRGDPVAAVRELKEQGDRHLVIYGYGQLTQTLLERGLVDELNFVINPVVLGSGIALFRPGKRVNVRLVSVTERRNGRGHPVIRKRLTDGKRIAQDWSTRPLGGIAVGEHPVA
jgi:dihydrofolate reductase